MRPLRVVDQRFESLYLFAACRHGTDGTFALALPRVNADAMTVFLEHFARQLEPGVHAVLVLDQAGWHHARAGNYHPFAVAARLTSVEPGGAGLALTA